MFRDKLRLELTSGNGGDGVISFRREAGVPRGGPDGGDGGDGGSINIVADSNVSHLGHFNRMHYKAEHGANGAGDKCHGRAGADIELCVPIGTQVWIEDTLIADLERAAKLCIAAGGKGGRGNAHFATAVNRAPRINTLGTKGVTRVVHLRLRLSAQIGLIGAPNAGKSSLLRALTNATPEVGNYAFTTLTPQIGIMHESKLSVIDIPGLIEGAHLNKGLGHEFLDHIAKCRILVCVLDITDDPWKAFGMLNHQLHMYDASLVKRIKLLVFNKCDMCDAQQTADMGNVEIPYVVVSALTGIGMDALQQQLKLLQESNQE